MAVVFSFMCMIALPSLTAHHQYRLLLTHYCKLLLLLLLLCRARALVSKLLCEGYDLNTLLLTLSHSTLCFWCSYGTFSRTSSMTASSECLIFVAFHEECLIIAWLRASLVLAKVGLAVSLCASHECCLCCSYILLLTLPSFEA
jgi:hypothetical protein